MFQEHDNFFKFVKILIAFFLVLAILFWGAVFVLGFKAVDVVEQKIEREK